jgi:hypothetical protein
MAHDPIGWPAFSLPRSDWGIRRHSHRKADSERIKILLSSILIKWKPFLAADLLVNLQIARWDRNKYSGDWFRPLEHVK